MNKFLFSVLAATLVAVQAYAEDAAPAPEAAPETTVEQQADKPKFKKCEKCFELRKKAREERKAFFEEVKKAKEEGKDVKELFEKKKGDKERGPVFCDGCKKKFGDKKPDKWHKNGRGPKPENMKKEDCPEFDKDCKVKPEDCPKFKEAKKRKARKDRREKFGPKKDKAPAEEAPEAK
ncbi:MAG: hypothetical protein J6V41_06640 [Kiritimatiellae bacterium]|nr:hypothetical protein [Kiritimatiellia bacterium]